MDKRTIPVLAILAFAMGANADVTVNFPSGAAGTYEVESQLITEVVKPRNERGVPDLKAFPIKDGKIVFSVPEGGASQNVLYTSEREGVLLYAMPGENLTVDITSMEPLEYTVKGTPLMEAITLLDGKGNEIKKEYFAIARSADPDEAKLDALEEKFNVIFSDYVKQHKEEPAAVYALLQLDGEDYMNMYDVLQATAAQSPLFPLALNKKERVEKSIEAEKRMEALQSGNVDAPVFTLKNPEGKDVSLSDFKGKWVILDFWGSWCPWCIKGFPALKEAYSKYDGKVEIIGVDCRDSEDAWRKALEKYQLPWVQVYNGPEGPAAEKLYTDYAVQGFPTKVIVSPEGKIANITVGEDPSFFTILDKLVNN